MKKIKTNKKPKKSPLHCTESDGLRHARVVPQLGASSKEAGMSRTKCLVLLSGGLDSRLACKVLEEQLGNRNLEAVFFALPFGGGCCSDSFCVIKFCQIHGFRLHVVDFTKGALFRNYMAMIMKPKYGRGTAMNPCIDCHAFMLKEAKKLAKKTGANVIATGEVLGERPLSQHRQALELVENEAGLKGNVLRPLSAKLLPETNAEKNGLVDRSRLLAIRGRGRSGQLALAKKYSIDFPNPGGGCLLTDRNFSGRLASLLTLSPEPKPQEIEMLKLGRHFTKCKAIIIVGRNHQENLKIQALADEMGLPALETEGFVGPTTMIYSKPAASSRRQKASVTKSKAQTSDTAASSRKTKANLPEASLRAAAMLTARYSDAPKGLKCLVGVKSGKNMSRIEVIAPHDTVFLTKKPQKPKVLSRKA